MTAPGLRVRLAVGALLSATGVAGTVAAWVLTAQVLAGLILGAPLSLAAQVAGVTAGLLTRALAGALRDALGAGLAALAVRHWRDALTAAALRLGPVALSGRHATDVAVLGTELEARLAPYYARYLPMGAHAAVSAMLVLAVTWRLDPDTALVLLLTGPLTVLFLALVGLAARAESERQWLAHTRLGGRLLTVVRHLPTLHAYGQVDTYRRLLDASAAAHRGATLRVLRVAFLSGFVMDMAATLSTALAAVWIGVRLFEGHAALAPTLAALMLMPEFFGPLRQLGTDRHAALDAGPLAARLEALLAERAAPSGAVRPSGVPALSLVAARADLAAPTAALTVAVLTLDVPPGAHVALQGASGSGKTSLLHALRKHVPHTGRVTVDGVPLDDLDAAAWQAQVAYVPQQPRLLSASVRENVRLLRPDAADHEVRRALAQVGLLPVIKALPGGLDAALGEGGVQLSGGEQARLGLARALLSRAGVVLLDEVTAHLDAQTEQAVNALLPQVFAHRTVLFATHRAAPAGFRVARLNAAQAAA